jgi:hypothetical protein
VNEFVRRLTEGPAVWGRVSVWPRSPGIWERYRLTVYPPGTSTTERRALRFARTWPIAGALIGSTGVIAVWPAGQLLPAAVILFVYVGGLCTTSRLTHDLRSRARKMRGDEILVAGVLTEYGDVRRLRTILALLTDLESRRRRGCADPVQYEAEWAAIYGTLPESDVVRV